MVGVFFAFDGYLENTYTVYRMTIGFANLRNAFYKRRFARSGVF